MITACDIRLCAQDAWFQVKEVEAPRVRVRVRVSARGTVRVRVRVGVSLGFNLGVAALTCPILLVTTIAGWACC